MGLKAIRTKLIKKLLEGRIQHEVTRSGAIEEKNLLFIGQISIVEVIEILNPTKGEGYSSSPHYTMREVEVHEGDYENIYGR